MQKEATDRLCRLEDENKRLIQRITDLARQAALAAVHEKEVKRLRQKIEKYHRKEEQRDAAFRKGMNEYVITKCFCLYFTSKQYPPDPSLSPDYARCE